MIEDIITTSSESTSVPSSCRFCSDLAIDFCKKCGQEFCSAHKSKYNPRLCVNCVSDATLQLDSEPLIDDDGSEHKGRHLKLIGEGWPNSIAALRDMSEEELEAHIAELSLRVKKAQLTLDYSQILKSAAEFDLADRQQNKIRKLRERRTTIEKGALRLNGASTTGNAAKQAQRRKNDPIQLLMSTMGIDYETAKKLSAALGK
jgi:hypothetical protein